LDRLRDQVSNGHYDQLLITAPDRLARKYVHQMLLIEEFEGRGCQVSFVERPMSQDPNDQLLLQIRGAVAEYERTLIGSPDAARPTAQISSRLVAALDSSSLRVSQ
jgi:site-specific DNA recombinase